MAPNWLRDQHISVLKTLLPNVQHRTDKRLLRECILGLTEQLNSHRSNEATELFAEEPVAPVVDTDLMALQSLLAKGVQHNGVIPELDAVQVTRSLQIMAELVGRAEVGALDHEDVAGLEWCFDVASQHDGGVNRKVVRRLEQLVRGGLGLGLRISTLTQINDQLH